MVKVEVISNRPFRIVHEGDVLRLILDDEPGSEFRSAQANLLALRAGALSIKASTYSDLLVRERLLAEASLLSLRSARIADPRNSSTSHPSPPKPPIG